MARVPHGDVFVQVGIEFDIDTFERVAQAAAQQLGAEGLDHAQAHAGGLFAVGIVHAEEVQLVMVKLGVEFQFPFEEPRLDESEDKILPLGAELHAQARLLAAALEPGRIEQVEVALGDFDKPDQAVDGSEAGAQLDVAGVFFADGDDEVAAVGHVGRLGLGFDAELLFEEVQTFEALGAALDLDHVEDLPWGDRQLAANHPVLGLGVALDLDLFDVSLVVFIDLVDQVHRAGLGIGVFARVDAGVDVALGAVHVLDGLQVLAQPLGGENLAHAHPEAGGDLVRGEKGYPFEVDRADLVLAAFRNDKAQLDFARALLDLLDLLQLEINVAGVPVELRQLFFVVVQLVFLEHARLSEEGEPPVPAGLEHAAELLLGKGMGAIEVDVGDPDLGAFGDLEGDGGPAGALVRRDGKFHLGFGITGFLVEFLDLLRVGKEFSVIEQVAVLGGDFLEELGVAEFLVSAKEDVGDLEPRLDDVEQGDAVIGPLFAHLHVEEVAGGIEVAHVIIDTVAVERVALFDADVGPHEGFSDRLGADIADGDADDFRLKLGRSRQGEVAQSPPEEATGTERRLPPKYPPEYLHR